MGENERDGCWREATHSVWPRGAAGGAGMEHGAQPELKKRQGEVDARKRGEALELRRAGSLVLLSAGSYICLQSHTIYRIASSSGEALPTHPHHQHHMRVNVEDNWNAAQLPLRFEEKRREERDDLGLQLFELFPSKCCLHVSVSNLGMRP